MMVMPVVIMVMVMMMMTIVSHLEAYIAGIFSFNPFVNSGTYMSHLQRVFSSPLG
jgi:hypothetical protein